MRVSVSKNFKIWRWIGFLFFRIKKSSADRLRISLPTDRVASRERFATSYRQPHENREGRTFHPVSIGRRESRPSSWRRWGAFRPSVVFAKDGLSRLFFLHARHADLVLMRGL